jgi:hypothetical protein
MTKKPIYEELEQRVRELEKESIERKQLEDALKSERDKHNIWDREENLDCEIFFNQGY